MIPQRREKSWAVTGDVGERGPAINLNGSKLLQNIQTKKFFNTVKGTGPCLGEHSPAIDLSISEKLHTIQTGKCFNTVKWAGSCLGEHDQPLIWTLLTICIIPLRKTSWTPRFELIRDKRFWGAQPTHQLKRFWMAYSHPDKKVF